VLGTSAGYCGKSSARNGVGRFRIAAQMCSISAARWERYFTSHSTIPVCPSPEQHYLLVRRWVDRDLPDHGAGSIEVCGHRDLRPFVQITAHRGPIGIKG
jgi:hypothetical protein